LRTTRRSRGTTWWLVTAGVSVVVLCAAALPASATATQSPSGPGESPGSTSTTTPDTTLLVPDPSTTTTPAAPTTTTAMASAAPSTTVAPGVAPAPASVTGPPASAPQQLSAELVPTPDLAPFPVALDAAGADVGGSLRLAELAANTAGSRTAALETELEVATAALELATTELRAADTERLEAEREATGSLDRAGDARRTAIAAATASLISSRVTPDPTMQLALRGTIDPDDLWARGLSQAIATPAGVRASQARSTADAAGRRVASTRRSSEELRSRVGELTADLDRIRVELDAARAERAAAETGLAAARDAALVAFVGGPVTPESQRASVLDIPTRMLDAYLLAERRLAVELPGCRMRWWVVAGIGAVETGHGTYRGAYPAADGVVRPKLIGPRLDGGAFARIGDTDGGRLDGDTEFDRAVGPMQFIPSTWAASGRDVTGDGVADPHDVYDAAYSAAHYLCRGARGAPVDTPEGFSAAAWSYNRSRPYGATTWQRAVAYSAVSPRINGGRSDS